MAALRQHTVACVLFSLLAGRAPPVTAAAFKANDATLPVASKMTGDIIRVGYFSSERFRQAHCV